MKQYLVPFNINLYDPIKAYNKLIEVDWTLNSKTIKVGDEVYFYCSRPVQKILMKGVVTKTNVEFEEYIDDSEFYINKSEAKINNGKTYTRIKLIYKYSDEKSSQMSFQRLRENGLKGNIQRTQMLDKNKELYDYINSINDIE